jgi:hypothetical protein
MCNGRKNVYTPIYSNNIQELSNIIMIKRHVENEKRKDRTNATLERATNKKRT